MNSHARFVRYALGGTRDTFPRASNKGKGVMAPIFYYKTKSKNSPKAKFTLYQISLGQDLD